MQTVKSAGSLASYSHSLTYRILHSNSLSLLLEVYDDQREETVVKRMKNPVRESKRKLIRAFHLSTFILSLGITNEMLLFFLFIFFILFLMAFNSNKYCILFVYRILYGLIFSVVQIAVLMS